MHELRVYSRTIGDEKRETIKWKQKRNVNQHDTRKHSGHIRSRARRSSGGRGYRRRRPGNERRKRGPKLTPMNVRVISYCKLNACHRRYVETGGGIIHIYITKHEKEAIYHDALCWIRDTARRGVTLSPLLINTLLHSRCTSPFQPTPLCTPQS